MSELEKARQTINEADREIARWFEQRLDAVRQVAKYKTEHGLPVEDLAREAEVLLHHIQYVEDVDNQPYYTALLREIMEQSKRLQHNLRQELFVTTSTGSYEIYIRRGGLHHAGDLFQLNRKVLIVSDSGVPEEYAMTVASQCDEAVLFVFEQGEESKCMDTYQSILQALLENHFTRTDCIVAVGGGVVGDIAGFAAATYMRGVDFYNVPTTLLSQVDASIGGKTAIDFGGYKNLVGAFYPPKAVLIDVDTLQTLSHRQVANGMAEIIKMAMTCDARLFDALENTNELDEEIVYRALMIKKKIVEADERETGLRKVLNFGHTLGHAYESVSPELLHGECVAMGIRPMCHPMIAHRVESVLCKWGLASDYSGDMERVIDACRHDKKASGLTIALVTVPEIGRYEIRLIPFTEFEEWYRGRRYYEKYIWE